jgi:hypothetical protein
MDRRPTTQALSVDGMTQTPGSVLGPDDDDE